MASTARYLSRPHIKSITNPRLKYVLAQVEKDLEWLSIPFGTITTVGIRDDFHTIYGRATRLAAEGVHPKYIRPLEKRLAESIPCKFSSFGYEGHARDIQSLAKFCGYPWKIEVSAMLLEDTVPLDSLYETLIHEYLHTVPGCLNHGKLWSSNAGAVSKALGIDVTRTTQFEDKGVTDQVEEKARYIVECQSCKKRLYRFRICGLVEHPEHYRCSCGGHYQLIKGKEYLPASSSRPSQSAPSSQPRDLRSRYPYVLECTSCHTQFGRQRMSKTISHPEHYRCPCGGSLIRIQ